MVEPAAPVDRDAGFGIYVHWPFCAARCPYCDFNAHVRREINEARYARALTAELAAMAARAPGRTVDSVFFGGGTPSLMSEATVAAVIEAIARHWRLAEDVEITLEANPTSVEAERFHGYRAAGINRVSLGIQALDDETLRFLGRLHDMNEALSALELARTSFQRVSFDLIYARPGQTPKEWAQELARACALAADHLSLYQLTIEPDTAFAMLHARGKLATPDEDLARALYDTTLEVTDAHGLPAYEISNHAKPGAESRHNLIYWRCGEWAGVGPGAHSRLVLDGKRTALSTVRLPEDWLGRVERTGDGVIDCEGLDPVEAADEFLVMGLRLREGIDPRRFEALRGRPLSRARIKDLARDELVEELPDGHLRATLSGFAVLNAVVADLAA